MDKDLNLSLPGNPRYQPKDLKPVMGYDYLARYFVWVELAVIDVFGKGGVIPPAVYALLTDEIRADVLSITTTEMDTREREVTGHDIRALVQLIQERMPEELRRWVHVPLTSYDVIDTARAVMFKVAHREVVRPKMKRILALFAELMTKHADDLQIGRTHGQHATPITFGFWLTTVGRRLFDDITAADDSVSKLVGKIAGPVGAKNALVWLEIALDPPKTFGMRFLDRSVGFELHVDMAPIATQIVPPEPLARYLNDLLLLSAALAQFADDCRQLMRSEIGEIGEEFQEAQVGSSTMAHKRNPVTFEGVIGAYTKNVSEYAKVLMTLTSEHQRDLTASSVMRDFPVIVVNLVTQIDALLRPGKKDKRPFLARIFFNKERARERALEARELALAEPLYLLLQTAGQYPGDAHDLVNHGIVPRLAGGAHSTMFEAVEEVASGNTGLSAAWKGMSDKARHLFGPAEDQTDVSREPYAGEAGQLARQTAAKISEYVSH